MPQLVPFYYLESYLFYLQGMPRSPILLCVLVLVLAIILLCTEQGSSTSQIIKQDQTVKIPRPSKADSPLIDLTYVDNPAARAGIIRKVVVDLNDADGSNLRRLWPQTSFQLKHVRVGNTVRSGLEMPDNTVTDYARSGTRYPEVQRNGHTGIWVPSMLDPRLFNLRVVTRGYPVETASIQAYSLTTTGTGTGQTMKSFIRK